MRRCNVRLLPECKQAAYITNQPEHAGQSETVTTIVGIALQILTLLGVVNNPTDKVNW